MTQKNYTEFVQLHKKYRSAGLEILAFPCNQFGAQEPKPNAEIKEFAGNYGAEFPLMDKVLVNGPQTHPLFAFLKNRLTGSFGSFIKWNFTKFLCDKEGRPVKRFGPKDNPSTMEADIRALLGLPPGDDVPPAPAVTDAEESPSCDGSGGACSLKKPISPSAE